MKNALNVAGCCKGCKKCMRKMRRSFREVCKILKSDSRNKERCGRN